jgi:HEPN domain-containing protein
MNQPNDSTDPRAWLVRARSNLILADRGIRIKNVLLEDLCFNAQQAAEKALKAVCIFHGLDFPKTHSLVSLIDTLEDAGINVPEPVKEADILTDYAVQSRYPGWGEMIERDEYERVLGLAGKVVFWAENVIQVKST